MTLMDKFDAVEIAAGSGITETDRQFCQKHQAAYQAALETFQNLLALWQGASDTQADILNIPDTPSFSWRRYLVSPDFPELTVPKITTHISTIHSKFVEAVVGYLNRTYHLSVSAAEVEEELMPLSEDESEGDDPAEDSEADSLSTVLRYEDIIDLILCRFDGRGFSEQAPYELEQNCHRAAWRDRDHQPNFEQKKNLVRIFDGACSYGYYDGCSQWYIIQGDRDNDRIDCDSNRWYGRPIPAYKQGYALFFLPPAG